MRERPRGPRARSCAMLGALALTLAPSPSAADTAPPDLAEAPPATPPSDPPETAPATTDGPARAPAAPATTDGPARAPAAPTTEAGPTGAPAPPAPPPPPQAWPWPPGPYYPPPPGWYPPPPGAQPPPPGWHRPREVRVSPQELPPPDDAKARRERGAASDGVHLHDGFFLRLGIGAGLLHTASRFDGTVAGRPADEAIGEIDYSGRGVALDVGVGAAVTPGVVLAYVFAGQIAAEPTVRLRTPAGESRRTATKRLGLTVNSIAIDWFPDPRGTLELGALFGLAQAGTGSEDDEDSVGWAAGAWGGYGLWVGDQHSLGAMLRGMFARTTNATAAVTSFNSVQRTDSTFTLSLLATMILN